MKKYLILSVTLLLGLSACGQPGAEVTPTASVATAAPTQIVSPAPLITVSPEPSVTPYIPEPMETVSPEPTAEISTEPMQGPSPQPTPTAEVELTPELPVEPSPELTVSPAPVESPARPDDEEVLTAYRAAKEAHGWMTDSTSVYGYDDSGLALDPADQQVLTLTLGDGTEEVLVFDRITRPDLDSLETLRGYLKSLFSDEIVDDLMTFQTQVFVEGEQGGLYALPSQVQQPQQPGVALTVQWLEEEEPVSCQISALVDGEETVRQSLYQKVGDKWVFTQFECIF